MIQLTHEWATQGNAGRRPTMNTVTVAVAGMPVAVLRKQAAFRIEGALCGTTRTFANPAKMPWRFLKHHDAEWCPEFA